MFFFKKASKYHFNLYLCSVKINNMKNIIKLLKAIVLAPFILVVVASSCYNWIFNRSNTRNVDDSSVFFLKSNYETVYFVSAFCWAYLYINIFMK